MKNNLLKKCKKKTRRFYITLVCALMIICFSFAGCGNKIKSNYKLSVDYIKEEKYQDALKCLEQAEKDGISIKKLYRLRGIAYIGLYDYENAILNLENALHESNGIVTSADIDLNYYLAMAYYKLGQLDKSYEIYTALTEIRPKSPEAYYLRGRVALDMDKLQNAQEDYNKAVACDKLNAKQYIRIYSDLSAAGFNNEAVSYINLALSNIQKPSEYELGVFNYYLGDYTQARNHLEASKETTNSQDGVVYLSKTYVALNDPLYAISICESYIKEHPQSPTVYNELGIMYAKTADYDMALDSFEKGLELSMESDRQYLLFNRIVALERTGQFSKAKEYMKVYIETYPQDAKAQRENIFLSSR